MKKLIFLILISLFVLFAGCTQQVSNQIPPSQDNVKVLSSNEVDDGRSSYIIDVVRFTDTNTKCYVLIEHSVGGSGISCL